MKRKLMLIAILVLMVVVTACGELPLGNTPVPPVAPTSAPAPTNAPVAPTYTPYPVQPTLTPYPTQPAPAATAIPPTAVPPPAPANAGWQKVTFPATVWRSGVAQKDTRYDVTFDPSQGGSADHPAYGWYYQPKLPAPDQREAHEVAITLRGPAKYRFTGPECRAWQNYDGNHPFDQGRLVVNAQNGEYTLQPNSGSEVWLFVKCNASAASGFSFEALEKLP